MSRTSRALDYLRGFVILMVVAFHCFIAYMASQPQVQTPFDAPPYDWTAHPIINSERWLGFDLFGAFQFLHLMQIMFFLSGVFVWPSLMRKGVATFLRDRLLRLGVPFAFGIFVLMPLAYFPVYRVGAEDPSFPAFWSHWTALSIWPSGPIWFLWYVLALNVTAAMLYWLMPAARALMGWLADYSGRHPRRFFFGLIAASALTYLPLATQFEPWHWAQVSLFAIQPGFALNYALYFLAGLAVGAHGVDKGLLGADAMLMQRWRLWLLATFAVFFLWIGAASVTLTAPDGGLPVLRLARECAVVLFAAVASIGSVALFQRFAAEPRPVLGPILQSASLNAYGLYLFHYPFVIWTQYALLDVALPAVIKGAIVLTVTLTMSWAISAFFNGAPIGARVLQGVRRAALAQEKTAIERDPTRVGLPD
jgi:glucans biosynthesis protein C